MGRKAPSRRINVDELLELDRACARICFEVTRDGVLQSVTQLLTERFGFDVAWLGELCNDEGGLIIRHTSGNVTDQFQGLGIRHGSGLGGKAFALGTVQWVNDYFASPAITHDYDGPVAREGIQRMVAAPISWQGRPLAVLLCGSREAGTYGNRAAAVVQIVAERTAAALIAAEHFGRAAERAAAEERRKAALDMRESVGAALIDICLNVRRVSEIADATALRDRLRAIERQASQAAATLCEPHGLGAASAIAPPSRVPSTGVGCTDLAGAVTRATQARCGSHASIAPREYDVLRKVATGETNQQIADGLGLTHNTIKTYLRNIMTKLDARNRVQAVSRARELGLL